MMGTLRRQNQNAEGQDHRLRLTVGTWVSGAPQLVESIGTRDAGNGERVMERHVSGALEDIIRWKRAPDAEPET